MTDTLILNYLQSDFITTLRPLRSLRYKPAINNLRRIDESQKHRETGRGPVHEGERDSTASIAPHELLRVKTKQKKKECAVKY